MANDPGLNNDTCIFMEAVPGDNGAHMTNPVWWLTNDIELIGPTSGRDVADAVQFNPVKVKFQRKLAGSNCVFPGDESLTVEVWVANPSIVMAPNIKGSAKRVGFMGAPVPLEGGNGVQQIEWVPSFGAPTDPDSPGQKCLVARCYPSSGTPDGESFFLPGDQHVAQRNLVLTTTNEKRLTVTVNTINVVPSGTLPISTATKLRAILDVSPSRFVVQTVRKRLPASTTPQPFRIDATP